MDSRLHSEVPGTKITPSSPTRPGPPDAYAHSAQSTPARGGRDASISPSASMSSMNSGLASAPWAGGSGGVASGALAGGAVGGAVGGISGLPGDRRTVGHGVPPPQGQPVDSTRHSYQGHPYQQQDQEVLRDGSIQPGTRTSSIGAVESHSRNNSAGQQDYGSAFGGRAYGSNSPASASTETFGIPGGSERNEGVPAHASGTAASAPVTTHGSGGVVSAGSNPFGVDLVIPYDISGEKGDEAEIERGYRRLTDASQSAGLRIASRPAKGKGKGQEEVWVFVGASDGKVKELIEREHVVDESHGLRTAESNPNFPSDRIRSLYDLSTASKLQHGLGITPGEGDWARVKSIAALHDDERDKAWVERWAVADWKTGSLQGLSREDEAASSRDQPPAVRSYFNYLVFYTSSLVPIAAISSLFWLFAPADSYPPAYAFALALYSTTFVACWRIRERKLAVRWGLRGVEQVIGSMRPQYVLSHHLTTTTESHRRADVRRDGKIVSSVPIIMGCGSSLGCVLMAIFFLEAFVGHLWDGFGKEVLPSLPTASFSLVVPQVVASFTALARRLVRWENHPTYTSASRSLTAKTFALNATVAFLGLYLSAYSYSPFGPYLMSYIHNISSPDQGEVVIKSDGVNTSIRTRNHPGAHRDKINASRLKSQVFAYTVTNQVINTFLEVGLPFILRWVNDSRSGNKSVKGMFNGKEEKKREATESTEDKFSDKVAAELESPEYNIFTDYAEMVTQFGYVVIWAIVWPLAPVFALINNYFESRSDALKICQHVRRPVGPRVESIGTWLDTSSIISWLGAWTSATLIYLFRPSADRVVSTTAKYLASFDALPSYSTIWGTLVRVALVALAASHAWFVLNSLVTSICEKLFWRGSKEQRIVDGAGTLNADRTQQVLAKLDNSAGPDPLAGHGFWNGAAEGEAEIVKVFKKE